MADERFVVEFVVDDNGALRILDQFKRKQDEAAGSTDKFHGSLLKATTVGNLLADAIKAGVTAAVRLATQTFWSAIDAAQTFHNTFIGLTTVASKFGIEADAVKSAALALATDRLLAVDEAAAGLKNLLASGFGLPEAIQLMEGFKDSAAFNRQASLSFGQAVVSATEGIKNQNSILVDNAGLTKNLSVIMKEAGLSVADLASVSSDAGIRAKFLGGLLKELGLFSGDAAKLTDTYSGSVSRLETKWTMALAKLGSAVTENEHVAAAINEAADALETFIQNLDIDRVKRFVSDAVVALREAMGLLGTTVEWVVWVSQPFLEQQKQNIAILAGVRAAVSTHTEQVEELAKTEEAAAEVTETLTTRLVEHQAVVTTAKDATKEWEAAIAQATLQGEQMRTTVVAMEAETKSWAEAIEDATKGAEQLATGVLPPLRERSIDVSISMDDMKRAADAADESFKGLGDTGKGLSAIFDDLVGDLNRTFQAAFEGGGGLSGALKSLGSRATSAFLSFLPGGELLSQFGGAIFSGAKSLFGKLFGGPSEAEKEARDLVKGFTDEINRGLTDSQLAEAASAGFANAMDAGLVVGVRDMFVAAGLTAEEGERAVQQLWDAIKNGGPEAVQAAIANINMVGAEAERIAGAAAAAHDENLKNLLASRDATIKLFDDTKAKFAQMEEAAKKYGISLHSLGPEFKRAKIDELAQQLIADFDLLIEGGANAKSVLRGMSDEVNDVVLQAQKFGTTIPSNMQPMLEQMLEAGLLVDENGEKLKDLSGLRFADSPTQQFEDMITKIDEMIEALTGPDGLIEALKSIPDKTINIGYHVDEFPDTPTLPAFPHGGMVPGMGGHRPVLAEPGEFVIRRDAVNRLGVGTVAAMNATGEAPARSVRTTIDLRGSVIANDQALADLADAIGEQMMVSVGDRARFNVVT